VAIDPLSRVEGHGKVTLLLDEHNQVQQARLHIVEFRGFEQFICGRPYWEVPVMVQRLCGICPVSHHLAASKALDPVVGGRPVTATADKMRRLMHYGQMMQSHALHFFHLSSPDLLFGFDAEVRRAQHRRGGAGPPRHREEGRAAAQVRPGGDPHATAGKRIHGTGRCPAA
jgi:NAD-reducing hydrogenase large subunit